MAPRKLKREDIIFYASGAIAGLILSIIGTFVIRQVNVSVSDIVYVVSAVIAFVPFLIRWYGTFNRRKNVENYFPIFLRDFIEAVRSGMTLPQSFRHVSVNDYGPLGDYVRKMSAQLDWGIPINKVLLNFSKDTKSKLIGRIVSTVIESHNVGGNLTDTFEALSRTTAEVDKLRRERVLYLQSQLITGYIVFFVFLAVIIGLQLFLTPSLTSLPTGALGAAGTTGAEATARASQYNEIYRNLILIQGLFAGLAVGKMSEGTMVAGIKHSLFMMLVGFVAFTLIIGNPNLIPIPAS